MEGGRVCVCRVGRVQGHTCAALSLEIQVAPGSLRAAVPRQRRMLHLSAPYPRRHAGRPEPRGAHVPPPLSLLARSSAASTYGACRRAHSTRCPSCGVTRCPGTVLLRGRVSTECGDLGEWQCSGGRRAAGGRWKARAASVPARPSVTVEVVGGTWSCGSSWCR